jgi:hypothetical protein
MQELACLHLLGDPFAFFRGDQSTATNPSFRHINVRGALRQQNWTLPDCVEHVTEKGRFEALGETETYILVRTDDGRLWQKHGPYIIEDGEGNLGARPDPQSSKWGLIPAGVMQLCVLTSAPFRMAEAPCIADVRPNITKARQSYRTCRDRTRLIEAIAEALFAYEAACHVLEEMSIIRGRIDGSLATMQFLRENLSHFLEDMKAFVRLAKAGDDESEVHAAVEAWLQTTRLSHGDISHQVERARDLLKSTPELKNVDVRAICEWFDLAPIIGQILQMLPGHAFAKIPWPNPPWSRSMFDDEFEQLLREILFGSSVQEKTSHRSPPIVQRLPHGSDIQKKIRRRERFQGQLSALKLVMYQGTWRHQSMDETPLYEILLLRMRDAFMRYGSSTWPDTFIEHVMVKILQQVGLEDLSPSELIVDRLRKRIERFENDLLAALKELQARRHG